MTRRDSETGRFVSEDAARPNRAERKLDALMQSFGRADGWANVFAGFGVRGRDPSLGDTILPPVEIGDIELEWLYRSDAMAARAVDVLPDDALRQGWDTKIAADDEGPGVSAGLEAATDRYFRRLKAKRRVRRGAIFGRLFGGGVVVIGIDDGAEDFSRPVDEEAIASVRWLLPLPKRKVVKKELETDTRSEFFGQPSIYSVQLHDSGPNAGEMVDIHASRLLVFSGGYAPELEGGWEGWSDSILRRLWVPLKEFAIAYASMARLVRTFNVTKYAMRGLAALVAKNKVSEIRRRLEIAEMSMSVLNAMLMDKDAEDVEVMQRPVAGLYELIDRFGVRLAGASGTPLTRLLGLSPGGFGTGEDEDRRWGDEVRAYQSDHLGPELERLTRYILLAKDGPTRGVQPNTWSTVFRPLRAPSEKETAEVQNIIAQARAALLREGVLLPGEVAEGMWGKGEFSTGLQLDREERDAFAQALAKGRKRGPTPSPPDSGGPPPQHDPDGGDDSTAPGEDSLDRALAATRHGAPREHPLMATMHRVLDSVRRDALTEDVATLVLSRVLGFPVEEAENLVAKIDRIEKRKQQWVVLSQAGRVLGTYGTEQEARERLRQIEAAKAAKLSSAA